MALLGGLDPLDDLSKVFSSHGNCEDSGDEEDNLRGGAAADGDSGGEL